ncbi:hypothetical protein V8C34DRAFT_302413 [Trichoderma compactum]
MNIVSEGDAECRDSHDGGDGALPALDGWLIGLFHLGDDIRQRRGAKVGDAQQTVDKESKEYQDFKSRSGLLNWDFSLACLFIDTSSSTKFSEELSSFGGRLQDYNNFMTDRSKRIF